MSRDRDEREDFASRWSRRKRAAQTAPAEPERTAEPESGAAESQSDEQILEELGLPDPDTLKPGDDVSAFMASAVPARLRNRALRRLWLSNPLLANLDGLIDYGEDYTDAAMVPEVLNTAYRVGRGWAEDEEVAEADADEAADEDAEDPAQPAGEGGDEGAAPAADTPPASEAASEGAAERRAPRPPDAGEESADHGTDEALAQDTAAPGAPEPDRADADPPARAQAPPTPRRRMRFRFPDS